MLNDMPQSQKDTDTSSLPYEDPSFVSLTSKEFREQVQSLKLDRKRRPRSARKVGVGVKRLM